ncbi:Hcp family type VI secretion system effector [Massilia sp. GCM10020059]|uniref:Type VI secretion system tube protein Hcp n=1 Tax=Massilia agrisoli TaxID=2892444 RepID=A0ABS8IUU9_9BURK|nr:type VI secretion system tube protein Hcp [Massilia agrisoli]MCC6072395.1 type VI secretion system tube protein Hcp [Massilia agrisoli]
MASDLYLQIDGIKGESYDAGHMGWIEVDTVSWAVTQPKSATASTGGGHTAERCEMTEISFTKAADLASPILLQMCAGGKTIPKARFEFMRADGADSIKYYEIELENVLIAHVAPSLGAGALVSESVGLKFSKVGWKYTQQKVGGGTAGNTAGGWDLASNRYA